MDGGVAHGSSNNVIARYAFEVKEEDNDAEAEKKEEASLDDDGDMILPRRKSRRKMKAA